jgi:hypothetical protein
MWDTYKNHQFSVNLPTEQLLRKTICAMWQILHQKLCIYVLVVFKILPCGTTILGVPEASDLFSWLRKFPLVVELEGLSLWWNSKQIYHILGQCSFILIIIIFTKWIISLLNDTLTLQGQTFYHTTYCIFYHFSYCRWVEMLSLPLSHRYNFVLFLWSYTFQQIWQLMWLYH